MPDKAASILAKLKNKAKNGNKSFQLCLQLFAQEELIRRIQSSSYSDNFVLKGGLLIYSLSGFESRSTVDIDFLLRSISNDLDKIREMLDDIIHINTGNDYIRFEIKKIEQIALLRKYPGVGFSMLARIKNVRIPFSVDLGIGDVIIPNHERRKLPTQLDGFDPPEINTYSLESTIAEKFDAILSMMELGSRMKDYFDIYYLSQNYKFDEQVLSDALRETFKNRDRQYTMVEYEHFASLSNNKDMIRKWNLFIKKLKLEHVEFSEVIKQINHFLYLAYEETLNR